MSTRKTAGAAAQAPAPAAALGDWHRHGLAAGTRAACAVFRGFEAMRRVQLQAAREALARHEAAAGQLAQPRQPADLLALQAELARYDLQGAALYWQQLGAAMVAMQRDLLAGVAQSAQEAQAATADTAGPQAGASLAGLAPFFNVQPPSAAAH